MNRGCQKGINASIAQELHVENHMAIMKGSEKLAQLRPHDVLTPQCCSWNNLLYYWVGPMSMWKNNTQLKTKILWNFIAVLTIKQTFCNLQPFAIMVGGKNEVHPSWLRVLITKFFQPSHNCVISAVQEISKINRCIVRALAYDLHQIIQRLALCIDDSVLQLLKASVNCHSAKNLDSKSKH